VSLRSEGVGDRHGICQWNTRAGYLGQSGVEVKGIRIGIWVEGQRWMQRDGRQTHAPRRLLIVLDDLVALLRLLRRFSLTCGLGLGSRLLLDLLGGFRLGCGLLLDFLLLGRLGRGFLLGRGLGGRGFGSGFSLFLRSGLLLGCRLLLRSGFLLGRLLGGGLLGLASLDLLAAVGVLRSILPESRDLCRR